MQRLRQVRHCYPPAFVELALLLADVHGVRNTALALALPLSTFYRWLERRRTTSDNLPATAAQTESTTMRMLVEACERRGFDLRTALARLGQDVNSANAESAYSVPSQDQDEPRQEMVAMPREKLRGHESMEREICSADSHREPDPAATNRSIFSSNVHHRLARARREIDAHYYSALSCEALARIASMSRFHFIRSFKLSFGISPYQYLMRVRVRCAKHLLDTTQQPLDAICAAVGFENPGSLYTAFERSENIGLSEYFLGMRIGATKAKAIRLRVDHTSAA